MRLYYLKKKKIVEIVDCFKKQCLDIRQLRHLSISETAISKFIVLSASFVCTGNSPFIASRSNADTYKDIGIVKNFQGV